jgi:hypothetical protein
VSPPRTGDFRVAPCSVEQDVSLVETDDANDSLDAAYQSKYGNRYPTIVPSIAAPGARPPTLELVPR